MDATTTASHTSAGQSGEWTSWLIGVPLTVVFLLVGLWFVRAMLLLRPVRSRVRALDRPICYTYLATAAVLVVVVALTISRDDSVDERVISAGAGNEQVASGLFVGVAHDASGTAAAVRVAGGGTKLNPTDLETDNGPDLRVYVVAGNVGSDSDVRDFRDLGGLKGNKGTRQYAIPPGVDLDRYSTVVI